MHNEEHTNITYSKVLLMSLIKLYTVNISSWPQKTQVKDVSLGLYTSAVNLHCNYVVTANPSETLHRNLM